MTDAERDDSWVSWKNVVVGGRCVMLFERGIRLLDVRQLLWIGLYVTET